MFLCFQSNLQNIYESTPKVRIHEFLIPNRYQDIKKGINLSST